MSAGGAEAFRVFVGGNSAGGAGESVTINGGSLRVVDTFAIGHENHGSLTINSGEVDAGSILIGKAARERLQTHPTRSAAVFKRHMGSNMQFTLGDRSFRAEELSALILRALKEDAEAALGQPVTEAIITVPAYFSDAQRKATRAAGQLATYSARS